MRDDVFKKVLKVITDERDPEQVVQLLEAVAYAHLMTLTEPGYTESNVLQALKSAAKIVGPLVSVLPDREQQISVLNVFSSWIFEKIDQIEDMAKSRDVH